jgi:hypothetical protein
MIAVLVNELDSLVQEHYVTSRPVSSVLGRPLRPFIRRLWGHFLRSVRAHYSAEADIEVICQLFHWFLNGFRTRMSRINSSPISEAAKAASRRAFYDEAMHNILDPVGRLTRVPPDMTPAQECIAMTLVFFWNMFMRMREFELVIYLRCGGKRPRRGSV